jgi:hypothetical protein
VSGARVFAAAAALCGAVSASAQEAGGENLSQAANDPTAPLMAFQLQDSYAPSVP